MFGRHNPYKPLAGVIAIAAVVAVVFVPTAGALTLITDTLGGNGYPKAQPDVFERYVAIHNAAQHRSQGGATFITDTLGGNGYPKTDMFERSVAIQAARKALNEARGLSTGITPGAYVNGGMSANVALSNAPSATSSPRGGAGFNWGVAGVGLGLAAALLLLVAALIRPKRPQRRVLAV